MPHQPTIDAYNKIADEYAYRNKVSLWQKEYEIFFNLLVRDSNLLEIGCGIGRDARILTDKYKYIGIDASQSMLDIAKRKVPQGEFRLMDFYDLSFNDSYFDGFWTAASLLHVPKLEIDKPLQEIRRVIKREAVGFISMKKKKVFDEGIIRQEKLGVERYFSFYSMEEFSKILERNNFEVLQVTEEIEDEVDQTQWMCFFVKKT